MVWGLMSTRLEISTSISSIATQELASVLLNEFDELAHRFYLGDFRPSELSGARFCEAAFRICQSVCQGNYTPIGKHLHRVDRLVAILEQTDSSKRGRRVPTPYPADAASDLRLA